MLIYLACSLQQTEAQTHEISHLIMELFRRKTKQGVFVCCRRCMIQERFFFTKPNVANENNWNVVSCYNFRTNKLFASFGFRESQLLFMNRYLLLFFPLFIYFLVPNCKWLIGLVPFEYKIWAEKPRIDIFFMLCSSIACIWSFLPHFIYAFLPADSCYSQ